MPTTTASDEIIYVVRRVRQSQYNGHADVVVIDYTNGDRTRLQNADRDYMVPSGTDVLCRLRVSHEGKKKEFRLEGLARIVSFSPDGRPIEFSDVIAGNHRYNEWIPPTESDKILDERV